MEMKCAEEGRKESGQETVQSKVSKSARCDNLAKGFGEKRPMSKVR